MAEPSKPTKDEKGRFLPGNIGGGRPKGSRNKLGEAFTEALYADFQEHGAQTIERVRVEDPTAYVKVVAGLLPKEVKVDTSPMSELSDDELSRLLDILRSAIGPALPAGEGSGKKGRGKPPGEIRSLQ